VIPPRHRKAGTGRVSCEPRSQVTEGFLKTLRGIAEGLRAQVGPRQPGACAAPPCTSFRGEVPHPPACLIGPLEGFWTLGEERIILAPALMAHLRKRTNAQRLRSSTCKAGALPTELRPRVLMSIDLVSANSQEYVRHAHSEPSDRTALEERLLFVPEGTREPGRPAGRPRRRLEKMVRPAQLKFSFLGPGCAAPLGRGAAGERLL